MLRRTRHVKGRQGAVASFLLLDPTIFDGYHCRLLPRDPDRLSLRQGYVSRLRCHLDRFGRSIAHSLKTAGRISQRDYHHDGPLQHDLFLTVRARHLSQIQHGLLLLLRRIAASCRQSCNHGPRYRQKASIQVQALQSTQKARNLEERLNYHYERVPQKEGPPSPRSEEGWPRHLHFCRRRRAPREPLGIGRLESIS